MRPTEAVCPQSVRGGGLPELLVAVLGHLAAIAGARRLIYLAAEHRDHQRFPARAEELEHAVVDVLVSLRSFLGVGLQLGKRFAKSGRRFLELERADGRCSPAHVVFRRALARREPRAGLDESSLGARVSRVTEKLDEVDTGALVELAVDVRLGERLDDLVEQSFDARIVAILVGLGHRILEELHEALDGGWALNGVVELLDPGFGGVLVVAPHHLDGSYGQCHRASGGEQEDAEEWSDRSGSAHHGITSPRGSVRTTAKARRPSGPRGGRTRRNRNTKGFGKLDAAPRGVNAGPHSADDHGLAQQLSLSKTA